jgi:hypothetical protein
VLHWLRVGMPYQKAGDWLTGAGFQINCPQALGWIYLMVTILALTGDREAERLFRIGEWS